MECYGPETNFVCGAYTHAASSCLMPGGRTLKHWRRAHGKTHPLNGVVVINEINQVPLSPLILAPRFKHLDAALIALGDAEGKPRPIYDGWPCKRIGDAAASSGIPGTAGTSP